jgi:hypothetical protein
MIATRSCALCGLLLFAACRREDPPVAPPPLPPLPVAAAEVAAPVEPAPSEVEKPGPTKPGAPAKSKAEATPESKPDKSERPKGWGAAYVPPPAAAPAAVPARAPAPKPAPVPLAPAPVPAKPKTRVSIPRTEHVHVEIPVGLQADLDADPRMQAWVDKVIAIADGCHAKARANVGTIEAQITMHENARPDPDVRSLPPQLGSLVACATGQLMRTKMPLFTGREGTRYAVRIVFE